MSDIPEKLKYTASHEWVRDNRDGTYTVGLTDHAQESLGDVVFVELPDFGKEVTAGVEAGTVESVKAASDIFAPLTGSVSKRNGRLENEPGLINSDPYGEGWLFVMKKVDKAAFDALLSAEQYAKEI